MCKGGSRAYKDISCYARPQHCQAGVQREPGRSPRNLQRKKESARHRNLKPGQNQKKKLDEKDAAKEHGAHGIAPKEHQCGWRKTTILSPQSGNHPNTLEHPGITTMAAKCHVISKQRPSRK